MNKDNLTTSDTDGVPRPGDSGLRLERRGALARILLDRPRQRNSIDRAMRRALRSALIGWARDPEIYAVTIRSAVAGMFCAGGDVKELLTTRTADASAAVADFGEELELIWRVECFPKPIVSLIDGPVMGTGAGLTLRGTHRVAACGYSFAMPETAIGFYPDVGVLQALSRLPHGLGTLIALAGTPVGPAAALDLGLATHCIDASAFDEIEARLQDADTVDPLLDGLHRPVAPTEQDTATERLAERAFAGRRAVTDILQALSALAADDERAASVLARLVKCCPASLEVTWRFLATAAGLDIRDTLAMDYRVGARLLMRPDFAEGIRAVMIDKDGKPRWQPATLADVDHDEVQRCFEPLPTGDLSLPPVQEMARLR